MSLTLEEKKKNIKGLKKREKQILDQIMIDPLFNLVKFAKSIFISPEWARSNQTTLFKALKAPKELSDDGYKKREWVHSEYHEAYYSKVEIPPVPIAEKPQDTEEILKKLFKGALSEPETPKIPIDDPITEKIPPLPSFDTLPPSFSDKLGNGSPSVNEPKINVSPPPARVNRTPIFIIGSIIISVIAVVILGVIIFIINLPSGLSATTNSVDPYGNHLPQGYELEFYDVDYGNGITVMVTSGPLGCVNLPRPVYALTIGLTNNGNQDVTVTSQPEMFALTDNNGKSYRLLDHGIVLSGTELSKAPRTLIAGDVGFSILTCWYGEDLITSHETYLDLRINGLFGLDKTFRINY